MIFATVGTQLPFDRLVMAVDAWAGAGARRHVFAQIGPSALRPAHIQAKSFLEPEECRARMAAADVIVAHAGMGTILTALELGKPLVVLPRVASLGEHRNEHQLATARRFAALGLVRVAFDETELPALLTEASPESAHERISAFASDRLIDAVRTFIDGAPVAPA